MTQRHPSQSPEFGYEFNKENIVVKSTRQPNFATPKSRGAVCRTKAIPHTPTLDVDMHNATRQISSSPLVKFPQHSKKTKPILTTPPLPSTHQHSIRNITSTAQNTSISPTDIVATDSSTLAKPPIQLNKGTAKTSEVKDSRCLEDRISSLLSRAKSSRLGSGMRSARSTMPSLLASGEAKTVSRLRNSSLFSQKFAPGHVRALGSQSPNLNKIKARFKGLETRKFSGFSLPGRATGSTFNDKENVSRKRF